MKNLQPQIITFVIYSVIMIIAGLDWVNFTNTERERLGEDVAFYTMYWLFIGFFSLLVCFVYSVRRTYNDKTIYSTLEDGSRQFKILYQQFLIYFLATYLIILYMTRQTGETGYWI